MSRFALLDGVATQFAFVSVDAEGEPHLPSSTVSHRRRWSDAVGDAVERAGGGDAGGLFLSSNTLVGAGERELTMRARELALELGGRSCSTRNLRLHRWSSRADARGRPNACVPGALAGARQPGRGEPDDRRGRSGAGGGALLGAGARLSSITLGPARRDPARRSAALDVAGVPAEVLSTIGAGDAFTGTLLARLALATSTGQAVAAALAEAVAAAARACERWGALD